MRFCAILLFTGEGQNSFCTETSMGVKNTTFCLKSDEIFLTFALLSFTRKWTLWNAGNSSEWPLGVQSKTAEHLSLIPRSSPLSNMTAEAGGVQDVKFLIHIRFTKSNLRGLPTHPPPLPILGLSGPPVGKSHLWVLLWVMEFTARLARVWSASCGASLVDV